MKWKRLFWGFVFLNSIEALAFPIPKVLNGHKHKTGIIHKSEIFQEIANIDYSGLVWFNNCSGFLVNIHSRQNSPVYVVTNGHCVGLVDQPPNKIWVDVKKDFKLNFLINNDQRPIQYSSDLIEYATMKGTDIAIIRLSNAYGELTKKGINGFKISPLGPHVNKRIIRADIQSMKFHKYKCNVEHEVHILKEHKWTWKGSYRHNCIAGDGASGSPLLSLITGKVVGIQNTSKGNGKICTLHNPCEMDEEGAISVHHNKKYFQSVKEITTCFNDNGEFDLYLQTCQLERP